MVDWCIRFKIPIVPVIYSGEYSIDKVKECTSGQSLISNTTHMREGCIVKPMIETISVIGRKILKSVSADYLAKKEN